MLSGKEIGKRRDISSINQFSPDDCQTEEDPNGMFEIVGINKEKMIIFLREIDCDPIHWKGKNGIAQGLGKDCKNKRCRRLNNCPISVHLSLIADID
jgi:hypothetical protein